MKHQSTYSTKQQSQSFLSSQTVSFFKSIFKFFLCKEWRRIQHRNSNPRRLLVFSVSLTKELFTFQNLFLSSNSIREKEPQHKKEQHETYPVSCNNLHTQKIPEGPKVRGMPQSCINSTRHEFMRRTMPSFNLKGEVRTTINHRFHPEPIKENTED